MSRSVRIGLIALGVITVLGGIVFWSIESEYGSGLDFSTRPADGDVAVYESSAGDEPVFVGSRDEASDYMARQRAEGENLVIPGAIIAVGALLIVVGVVVGRREPSGGGSTP